MMTSARGSDDDEGESLTKMTRASWIVIFRGSRGLSEGLSRKDDDGWGEAPRELGMDALIVNSGAGAPATDVLREGECLTMFCGVEEREDEYGAEAGEKRRD